MPNIANIVISSIVDVGGELRIINWFVVSLNNCQYARVKIKITGHSSYTSMLSFITVILAYSCYPHLAHKSYQNPYLGVLKTLLFAVHYDCAPLLQRREPWCMENTSRDSEERGSEGSVERLSPQLPESRPSLPRGYICHMTSHELII